MTRAGLLWIFIATGVAAGQTSTTTPVTPMFTPPPGNAFPAGASPRFVAVGDFNGDHISDVAVVNPYSNTVTVGLGTLAGALVSPLIPRTQTPIASINAGGNMTNSMASSVAAGYFRAGKGIMTPDLAVTNLTDGTVTILFGDGTGNFSASPNGPVSLGNKPLTIEPMAIAVGDFDQDGNLDLAVANAGNGTVSVLFGAGDGTFSSTSTVCGVIGPVTVGNRPVAIAAGNFGGLAGMAVANQMDGTVTVISIVPNPNMSDSCTAVTSGPFPVLPGLFNPPYPYPSGIAVADVNLDGYPDIITANDGTNNVSVLLGDGLGGFAFAAGSPIAVGANPVAVTAADFNEDGNPDLAIANYGSGNVWVLSGAGTGGFGTPTPFATGPSPVSVAMGDFNGEGKPSLAVANESNNTVTILLNGNTPALTVVSGASLTAPVSPGSVIGILGKGLEGGTASQQPFTLDGTSVTITYSNNLQDVLCLITASSSQVTALIPTNPFPGVWASGCQSPESGFVTPVPGLATVSVITPTKTYSSLVDIVPYAPALFSANENGAGVALGMFMSNGVDDPIPTYQCASATTPCEPNPCPTTAPCGCPSTTPCGAVALNLSSGGTLMLFATGLDNATTPTAATAKVTVGGMEPQTITPTAVTNMPGWYTLSVTLSASTKVRGTVPIVLSVTPAQCAGTLATPSVPCPAVVSNVVTVLIE